MRVGLLVCDHVLSDLVDVAGDYDDMFFRLFADADDVELVAYDVVNGELPSDPADCEAWITTGSRHSVNDDLDWIRYLEEFIQAVPAARTPLIGVCFGHQLIARAMGGSVIRSPRGWGVGSVEVHLLADGSLPGWMQPLRDKYRILNSHADQVVEVPEGTVVLGSTTHCPVSLMTVGEYLMGIQGHPEMEPRYLRSLIEMRRGDRIPHETAAKGLESLGHGSDCTLIRQWMLNFITSRS